MLQRAKTARLPLDPIPISTGLLATRSDYVVYANYLEACFLHPGPRHPFGGIEAEFNGDGGKSIPEVVEVKCLSYTQP